ncbi:uncharacterized protein C8R40DRAFT_1175728 [Lentinula edodes]|uniref:uncharacterized protein n=1 Tax=Lentinula edodes TaxID=5353 RepID=UPI001E8EC3D2|nr:uncharacterized protein C8R40DRAFT_1175728 [Lentinula edodes]KAH7870256.1 hypothetical protein C8R40DRAFT_1175728 [Lentinula edodes]
MSHLHHFKVLATHFECNSAWRSELMDPDLDLKTPSSSHVVQFLTHSFPNLRTCTSLSNFKSWFHRFKCDYPLTHAALIEAAVFRNHRNRAKMVDHEPIWAVWYDHLRSAKQSDVRIGRKPMMRVASSLLQHDLDPNESARFVDKEDGTPVMMAICDFCSLVEIVNWVNDIVLRNVACQHNVRKEDAGCIVICGWSAGSRSKPAFDFVRNFLSSKSEDEKHSLCYEAASVFALFWNMICALGPEEVLSDIENFLSTTNIYGMDANVHAGGPENMYTVPIMFRNARMAPPSGVFAHNYAW